MRVCLKLAPRTSVRIFTWLSRRESYLMPRSWLRVSVSGDNGLQFRRTHSIDFCGDWAWARITVSLHTRMRAVSWYTSASILRKYVGKSLPARITGGCECSRRRETGSARRV